MGANALDAVMDCLVKRRVLRFSELAGETGLPQEVVAEVVSFLVRYDLAGIEPNSSLVILRDDAISPHVLAVILETVLSRDPSFSLRWS